MTKETGLRECPGGLFSSVKHREHSIWVPKLEARPSEELCYRDNTATCFLHCFLLLGAKKRFLGLPLSQAGAGDWCWPLGRGTGCEVFFLFKSRKGQANAPSTRSWLLKNGSRKGSWAPWRHGSLPRWTGEVQDEPGTSHGGRT